jgi:hypothetical protein
MVTNQEVKDFAIHFQDKESFRKLWVNGFENLLGKTVEGDTEKYTKQLNTIFEKHYKKRKILLRNTYLAKDYILEAFMFIRKCLSDWILFENGGIFLKHEKGVDITIELLDAFIDTRTFFKKAKLRAAAEGDSIKEAIYAITEQIAKIIINGFYGLSAYKSSPQFNLLVGDSCTASSRSTISIAALTIELFGGHFRHYDFVAHIKSLEMVQKEIQKKPKLNVTLRNVTVEEALKSMLGPYYGSYYMENALRETLSHQTQEVLNRVFYKHNFPEFLDIPEVDALHKKLMSIWGTKDSNGKDIQFLNSRAPMPEYADDIKLLREYINDVIYGTYWYEGDNYEGIHYQTPIEIVENMKRYKVAAIDTDSVLTTTLDEINLLKSKYGILANNDDVLKYSIPILADTYHVTLISTALWEYITYRGIDASYRKYIIMEDESLFSQIHLTNVKKNYIGSIFMSEGMKIDDKKLATKGLALKKSNFNANMSKDVKNLLQNQIMVNLDKMDLNGIVEDIKAITSFYRDQYRDEKSILKNMNISKLNDELQKTNYGDYRRKAVEFHNRLFPENKIDIPGTFGIISLQFTPELIDYYKDKYPDKMQTLYNYAEEMYYHDQMNKMFTRCDGIYKFSLMEDDINESLDKLLPNIKFEQYDELFKFTKKCISDFDDKLNDFKIEYYHKFYERLSSSFYGQEILKTVNIDKININKIIIEKINRTAVPIDSVELYDFFKEHSYELIDNSPANVVEALGAPVIASSSIITPRNKNGKYVISNVIDSY